MKDIVTIDVSTYDNLVEESKRYKLFMERGEGILYILEYYNGPSQIKIADNAILEAISVYKKNEEMLQKEVYQLKEEVRREFSIQKDLLKEIEILSDVGIFGKIDKLAKRVWKSLNYL